MALLAASVELQDTFSTLHKDVFDGRSASDSDRSFDTSMYSDFNNV